MYLFYIVKIKNKKSQKLYLFFYKKKHKKTYYKKDNTRCPAKKLKRRNKNFKFFNYPLKMENRVTKKKCLL